jgi:hypothetical protein
MICKLAWVIANSFLKGGGPELKITSETNGVQLQIYTLKMIQKTNAVYLGLHTHTS